MGLQINISASNSHFQADINKPNSLARICSAACLLVSCVSPFRLYGMPVVKACVEAGIDYLDITGEPEFMERMEAAYHFKALENGSLVVSVCGYDSTPAELGLIFNTRQWVPPFVPNSVDSYLVLHSSGKIRGSIGTYQSAVLGIASARELQKLRASRPRCPSLQVPGPGLKKLSLVHWEENSGTWALKLLSADAIVVYILIISFQVEAEKPNPTIFLKACELLGVELDEAVHVGDDRRNDVWGARDAGCDAWLWGGDVHSFREVANRIGVELPDN